ncbi:hypothetical protein TWF281_004341 [Arthrobotrys megalospora]
MRPATRSSSRPAAGPSAPRGLALFALPFKNTHRSGSIAVSPSNTLSTPPNPRTVQTSQNRRPASTASHYNGSPSQADRGSVKLESGVSRSRALWSPAECDDLLAHLESNKEYVGRDQHWLKTVRETGILASRTSVQILNKWRNWKNLYRRTSDMINTNGWSFDQKLNAEITNALIEKTCYSFWRMHALLNNGLNDSPSARNNSSRLAGSHGANTDTPQDLYDEMEQNDNDYVEPSIHESDGSFQGGHTEQERQTPMSKNRSAAEDGRHPYSGYRPSVEAPKKGKKRARSVDSDGHDEEAHPPYDKAESCVSHHHKRACRHHEHALVTLAEVIATTARLQAETTATTQKLLLKIYKMQHKRDRRRDNQEREDRYEQHRRERSERDVQYERQNVEREDYYERERIGREIQYQHEKAERDALLKREKEERDIQRHMDESEKQRKHELERLRLEAVLAKLRPANHAQPGIPWELEV